MSIDKNVIKFLNAKVDYYNSPNFITTDPICIPHQFSQKQDIEISGFFAAIFAWGNRTTIINKATELMQLMDAAPYQYCTQHQPSDLKKLLHFKHRTFTATDLLYFIQFFKHHYSLSDTLETAFTQGFTCKDKNIENALIGFYSYFFSLPNVPFRTIKHIATPIKKSTCKRLSMYLRWMVRHDDRAVDFGMWKNISPAQLVIPLDVHVARVARHFKLIQRTQNDWATAVALTDTLKKIDKHDPTKYDFALFSLGVIEKF